MKIIHLPFMHRSSENKDSASESESKKMSSPKPFDLKIAKVFEERKQDFAKDALLLPSEKPLIENSAFHPLDVLRPWRWMKKSSKESDRAQDGASLIAQKESIFASNELKEASEPSTPLTEFETDSEEAEVPEKNQEDWEEINMEELPKKTEEVPLPKPQEAVVNQIKPYYQAFNVPMPGGSYLPVSVPLDQPLPELNPHPVYKPLTLHPSMNEKKSEEKPSLSKNIKGLFKGLLC